MRFHRASIFAAILASACGQAAQDGIKLGAILSTSGDHGQVGQAQLLSMQLAVDEINAAGGVNGRTLLIVSRDDQNNPDRASEAARDLMENVHVAAILGTTNSAMTLPVLALTVPANILVMTDVDCGPAFATADTNDTVFCTAEPLTRDGQVLADRAIAKHFTKAAIIAAPDPYGREIATGFAGTFTQGGGTITASVSYVEASPEYAPLLREVFAAGRPDTIVLAGYAQDSAEIIEDYLETYTSMGVFWFFGPAQGNPDFATAVGPDHFTFPHEGVDTNAGPGSDAFTAAFQKAFPTTTSEPEPGAYDGVYAIALAMTAAGSTDSDAMKPSLRAINDPSGVKVGPGEYRHAIDLLRTGSKINYEGASGSVDFDAHGNVNTSFLIWAYVNGSYTVIVPALEP
jgi:ABC-type branched-subunit amino acid transport system substrate-binding protein